MQHARSQSPMRLPSQMVSTFRPSDPARVLRALQNHTLDHVSSASDAGRLLADTKAELQTNYKSLSTGTRSSDKAPAGNKSSSKRGSSSETNKRLKGSDRKAAWEEVRALRTELRQRERGLFTSTLAEANVVLSTLHGASGGILERSLRGTKPTEGDEGGRKRRFDTIVIDEACQAIEASTWGAILERVEEGGRVILAGDDRQLGPVVKSEGDRSKIPRNSKAKNSSKVPKGGSKDAQKATGLAESAEALTLQTSAQAEPSSDKQDAADAGESDEEAPTDGSQTNGLQSRPHLRPPKSLHTTMFSRLLSLYGSSPAIKSFLTIQYRMNDLIMEFPNRAMYDGQLVAHESCRERWLGDGSIPEYKGGQGESDLEEVKGGRVVFYDTAGSEMYEASAGESSSSASGKSSPLNSDSKSNAHEVDVVLSHCKLLLAAGIPATSITILAPYSSQVSLLSATLSTSLPPEAFGALEIGTIDGLQGREQDVVIISLTRSNEEHEVGFLRETRRLNVAMTRAKRQLVVVGDSETVSAGGAYLKAWMEWLDERAVVEPVLP